MGPVATAFATIFAIQAVLALLLIIAFVIVALRASWGAHEYTSSSTTMEPSTDGPEWSWIDANGTMMQGINNSRPIAAVPPACTGVAVSDRYPLQMSSALGESMLCVTSDASTAQAACSASNACYGYMTDSTDSSVILLSGPPTQTSNTTNTLFVKAT